ncbi:MAG: UvrD-helicase domain-containing protein [Castellaniella sp.]|uniref:UvrD-helicase domain-containing protein n=1 Tax=Castellaniella sp. TaxID=1955812 RepID=UPI003C7631BD
MISTDAKLQSTANAQQLEAILATDGPVLIIAGPGSGKTFTLVERIVYLITNKGIAPESLFVVTFTDKAARELTTRISNRLTDLDIRPKTRKIGLIPYSTQFSFVVPGKTYVNTSDTVSSIFWQTARISCSALFDTLGSPIQDWHGLQCFGGHYRIHRAQQVKAFSSPWQC